MEKLMEMEYVINGEKYIITATKVEENNNENLGCDCPITNEPCDLSSQLPEYEIEASEDVETPHFVSVSDIPDGISIDNWLFIAKEFGIILTK